MERGRSFSGGWKHSDRTRPPRIATVKPVSKSFSEDDLIKAVEDRANISPRVISRLKIQDLTALKKDNLISELEKCLGELEEEHDATNKIYEVYGKVENERDKLLDELEVAFQDLQEYMKKQKEMEEQNTVVETDRDELIRENEYLKAVLSNRTEIRDNKLDEENRTLSERVKDLESKNTQLVDEINELYEERHTLISSLLNLRSEEVDDVVKRSRSSSLASRDSSSDADRLKLLSEGINEQVQELEVFLDQHENQSESHELCKKTVSELNAERVELNQAFKRVKKERDVTERELDKTREEKEHLEKIHTEKINEVQQLIEERNEKNLNISELKLEKRTLQRQLDHMRESSRATATKMEALKEDNEDLKASLTAMSYQIDEENELKDIIDKLREEVETLEAANTEMEAKIVALTENISEEITADVADMTETVPEEKEDSGAQLKTDVDSSKDAVNVEELRQENKAFEERVKKLQAFLEESKKEKDEITAQLRQLIEENSACNDDIQNMEGQLKESNEKQFETAEQLRHANEEKQTFSGKIKELEALLENSKTENAVVTKKLRQESEEQKKLNDKVTASLKISKKENVEISERLGKANEEKQTLSENVNKLEKTLEKNKKDNCMFSEKLRVEALTTAKNENAEISGRLDKVVVEKDTLNKKIEKLEKTLEQNRNENSLVTERLRVEAEQRETYSKTIENLEKSVKTLEKEKTEMVEQLHQASQESNALNAQIQKLQGQLENSDLENKQKTDVAEKKYRKISEEKYALDGDIKSLGAMLETSKKEKKDLQEQFKHASKQKKTLTDDLQRLKVVLESNASELSDKDDTILALRKENSEFERKVDAWKVKHQQAKAEYNKLDLINAELKRQTLKLSNDMELADKQTKNRINTLEIENSRVVSSKETTEKLLKRRELEIQNLKLEKESFIEQINQREKEISEMNEDVNIEKIKSEKFEELKNEKDRLSQKCQQYEKSSSKDKEEWERTKKLIDNLSQKKQTLEVELSNCKNNFNTIKIENERLTKKLRQSETQNRTNELSSEMTVARNTNKELEESNELLIKRIQSLESSENNQLVKSRNEEREKYATLLWKYDAAYKELDNLKEQFDNTTKEKGDLEQVVGELTRKVQSLIQEKQAIERDFQYIFQSRKEEAETVFSNKRSEIEYERDTIKAKYELQRVACDKMTKEKEHYIMTINTLRDENGKLHDQIRKQRLISSSAQDLMMQRLRGDNETLEKQIETLNQSLNKCIAENKELLNRIGKQDDNTLTTIRSLKARKNELQLKVSTLSHEKEQLLRQLKEKKVDSSNIDLTKVQESLNELEVSENTLKEQLMNAHAKIAELELDNTDYGKKLQESEGLLYDLQTALAQANDLAMQKSLEATKGRRQIEIKNDKLVKENTELKRKIYFAGKSNGEISPTSLFLKSSTNFKLEEIDGQKNRKASLPASIEKDSNNQRGRRLSSIRDNRSYPLSDLTPESRTGRGNSTSSQVEQDLSQQLRELLDLTNDLTKSSEEETKNSSDESTAPPVPPLPLNYETIDRKKKFRRDSTSHDEEKQEDWV